MKRTAVLLLLVLGCNLIARADHITGGEMFYTLIGSSGNDYHYAFTLKLYMRCNSGRQFNNPASISIFDRVTGERIQDISVALSGMNNISLPLNSNPCITNPPTVCYDVGYYQFNLSLPGSPHGYILASQVNYRIAGISNLTSGYSQVGALYTAEIPANTGTLTGAHNNSAHFTGNDLVVVCADNAMSYSFAAEDADGDQLEYSFCSAYQSGGQGNGGPTQSPPFTPVPYGSGFSGNMPLGLQVSINSQTGLITGTAPAAGIYVVTVCVNESRNGNIIATQRKDLQIFIAPCTIAAASLDPSYSLCRNSKTISISNQSSSPLIHSYYWEIKNNAGVVLYSSTDATAVYSFTDTGTYRIKLQINPGDQCSDSASSLIRVYPGFTPDFSVHGVCVNKLSLFNDASTSVYGKVNSWQWDFGEPSSVLDVSSQRNPAYTYPDQGIKQVQLIATDTKGCIDTIVKAISIVDKPPLFVSFHDTLICLHDILPLHATGEGNFSWTPVVQIQDAGTADPTVSPPVTTTYIVTLDDQGCLNSDSVRVRVTDHVQLQLMNDTIICAGDTIRMHIQSDGLKFAWSPAGQFLDAGIANALCFTPATTTYKVTASIGGCSLSGQVKVTAIPYPVTYAGQDETICYGLSIQLQGSSDGNSFSWQPATSLNKPSDLNPLAQPRSTTTYILTSYSNAGCPKPGRDSVVITVRPRIHAFAGNDTAVVTDQPLQLHATGGISYQWFPPTYLSSTGIPDPVAQFPPESEGIRYKVLVFDASNCVDSAFISIKIFNSLPSIFVPTAFTPNGDGLNDILKPVSAGMLQIENFSIYNRWGQLVFRTSIDGMGWDGKINGREQGTGSYIWYIKAKDYKGNPYFGKGTFTLIR